MRKKQRRNEDYDAKNEKIQADHAFGLHGGGSLLFVLPACLCHDGERDTGPGERHGQRGRIRKCADMVPLCHCFFEGVPEDRFLYVQPGDQCGAHGRLHAGGGNDRGERDRRAEELLQPALRRN